MAESLKVDDALQTAQEVVDRLYEFRDHYFEKNDLARAIHKTKDVEKEMERALGILNNLQDKVTNKATYLMLQGKTLNVLPRYDQGADDALSRAVKLDPKLVEAWNQLGECYWKNKDIEGAKNCFVGALNHSRNKVSLRNLSMVLRQLGSSDAEEKNKNVMESVEIAKEAVQMDIADGTSWFILGNAYLSLFFSTGQNPAILVQCLRAYTQGERDSIANSNPDLHYNRSIAYKYQEEYQLAIIGFSRAAALDPTWSEPKEKLTLLLEYLSKVTDLVNQKGKLKSKRLKQLMKSMNDKDLGPYGGGSYTSSKGDTVELQHVTLVQLIPGVNHKKVVLGKVVCSVAIEEPIPFTFAMVDSEGTCFAVTLYNIAPGYGVIIGDSVAIPEPNAQENKVEHEGKTYKYYSIRVETPIVIVVNGKKLGIDKQAPSVLGVSAKSE
ncbi:tetratricopeptide repeat protein 5-like [Saccoglossus kowalevskii]|uniref:Tetratricopeptide repeat protein 5-like n=1 Tax=Saccoglossus kowalevskii TaxID=10224 RepID=A0ABM0GQV4_SACKO|nr:PREDICTED: tetratricopeptide repeat protein 5-like [Saccoglossus kowalevskii]